MGEKRTKVHRKSPRHPTGKLVNINYVDQTQSFTGVCFNASEHGLMFLADSSSLPFKVKEIIEVTIYEPDCGVDIPFTVQGEIVRISNDNQRDTENPYKNYGIHIEDIADEITKKRWYTYIQFLADKLEEFYNKS